MRKRRIEAIMSWEIWATRRSSGLCGSTSCGSWRALHPAPRRRRRRQGGLRRAPPPQLRPARPCLGAGGLRGPAGARGGPAGVRGRPERQGKEAEAAVAAAAAPRLQAAGCTWLAVGGVLGCVDGVLRRAMDRPCVPKATLGPELALCMCNLALVAPGSRVLDADADQLEALRHNFLHSGLALPVLSEPGEAPLAAGALDAIITDPPYGFSCPIAGPSGDVRADGLRHLGAQPRASRRARRPSPRNPQVEGMGS
ncbi:unnamed protein product [Prorocentrum cordatum]|uniref:Trimethylguanosine synthase n=1 Tax=Prorocentrum cordatum TaxID=2364126 RepID=A0ABN9UTX0_9DINO|nr:unnamed protein product [Polarella glacialis]